MQQIEANGGHYKCEKCGAIDIHPLENCKMIETKSLAPRNVEYRMWLYQNSPETQKEIKRAPVRERREIQCHECKEWGHKARYCPNRQKHQKWTASDDYGGWARDSKKNWYKLEPQEMQQRGSSSSSRS